MGTSLNNIFISDNLKFRKCWKVCVPMFKLCYCCFSKFQILIIRTLKVDKFENVKLNSWELNKIENGKQSKWTFLILKKQIEHLQHSQIAYLPNWTFPNLRYPNWQFEYLKIPSTLNIPTPTLHLTTFLGDTMSSMERRSSELGGNFIFLLLNQVVHVFQATDLCLFIIAKKLIVSNWFLFCKKSVST